MPTFKHPCPYCGTFIDGSAVACPFCGVTEPFTHGRCPACRAQLQPGWIACPQCGRTLTSADTISPAAIGTTGAAMGGGASSHSVPSGAAPAPAPVQGAAPAPAPASTPGAASQAVAVRCSGCGAPLPAGARFCQECGTLVS